MYSSSKIILDQEALAENISFLRKVIGEEVVFSSVVKGNAYGHGLEIHAPLAEACGINHFSVFSADEAYRVKGVIKEDSQVMIMGDIHDYDLEWVIDHEIDFFVFDIERVEKALIIAKRLKKKARLHIEVETGLNRTGFNSRALEELIPLLNKNNKYLSVEGLCTHYAGAESIANYVRVQKQIKRFNKYHASLVAQGVTPKARHTACSAAVMAYPKTHMDMVRIGIMQYGFWPSKEILIDYLAKRKYNGTNKIDPLKRVMRWVSHVMSIKEVKTGEFVGYGTSFLAQQPMVVAAVPVGYAYGYSRALSNQGWVIVGNRRVAVIGTVNMNMMMVDVTDVEGLKKGMEVVLIGEQDGMDITVASFGELSNQLNYELLTRLPLNIPRVVMK